MSAAVVCDHVAPTRVSTALCASILPPYRQFMIHLSGYQTSLVASVQWS
jgi:hypothetical protein